MLPGSFCAQLADYILSGHAFLHIPTTETTRFLTELNQLAESLSDDGRQVFTWSHAMGWRDQESKPPEGVQFEHPDPQKVAQEILELPEESLFVLRDFGFYLNPKTYSYADLVIAWLCEIRDVLANTGRTALFLGNRRRAGGDRRIEAGGSCGLGVDPQLPSIGDSTGSAATFE